MTNFALRNIDVHGEMTGGLGAENENNVYIIEMMI